MLRALAVRGGIVNGNHEASCMCWRIIAQHSFYKAMRNLEAARHQKAHDPLQNSKACSPNVTPHIRHVRGVRSQFPCHGAAQGAKHRNSGHTQVRGANTVSLQQATACLAQNVSVEWCAGCLAGHLLSCPL